MAVRQKTKKRLFSVDRLMTNVALTLVRDFQDNLSDPTFCCEFQSALRTGVASRIREAVPAPDYSSDVSTFKATYQLESVMKRYRYRNDIYSDAELTMKAINAFKETQHRLRALDLTMLPADAQHVLDVARSYIARVLGEYSDEEHRTLSRFGRRASVGIPARKACLAERFAIPISGSPEQISWFDSEMSQDYLFQEIVNRQKGRDLTRSTYQETSSLTLTLVPKTFKSLRAIMPNTTIGSYMSYGLGEMIRKRLKREGYDISSLQMRHRYLARSASENNLLVTADLSSASDSISVALVERLFPPDWIEILRQSRIGTVVLPNGESVESLTFCTMGIGYTFPLQTLVFLSLLKAIEATLFDRFDRRTISVYGDDLIFSGRMYQQVVRYFEQFGFVINLDKTFHDGHFRESCGGDYFRGVDVRPFQPRNGAATVGAKTYEAVLYKYVNTLLARWSEYEIGKTLDFLTSEIEAITGKVKLVPGDYPDDSGVKCPTLTAWVFLRRAKCSRPKHIGHGVYRFSYLRLVSEEREELRHGPYLWSQLRGSAVSPDSSVDYSCLQELPSPIQSWINEIVGIRESTSELLLREVKPIKTIRGISGRRLRRMTTCVIISHTGSYQRRSGTSCFEDRRQ